MQRLTSYLFTILLINSFLNCIQDLTTDIRTYYFKQNTELAIRSIVPDTAYISTKVSLNGLDVTIFNWLNSSATINFDRYNHTYLQALQGLITINATFISQNDVRKTVAGQIIYFGGKPIVLNKKYTLEQNIKLLAHLATNLSLESNSRDIKRKISIIILLIFLITTIPIVIVKKIKYDLNYKRHY